jgi:acyl-CoA thioesterase-1
VTARVFTAEQTEFLIQFLHPEKTMPWALGLDANLLAPLYGVDVPTYSAIRQQFAKRVCEAAREHLADSSFARRVDKLPFAPGSVVVGLGDSITDDYQSWLQILRELLMLRRGQDAIQVINAGVSGDTTSQIITRFLGVVNLKPDWIISMIGTNDARLHGHSATKCVVSIEETEKNLEMLRSYAASETNARWVWITPAPCIPEKLSAHWWMAAVEVMFRNEDSAAVAELIRRQPGVCVDLQPVFGLPANPALLMDDGLHPNLAGQKAIVKALVEQLTNE